MRNLLIVIGVARARGKDLKNIPERPIYDFINTLTTWFEARDYETWCFTDELGDIDGLDLQTTLRNDFVEGWDESAESRGINVTDLNRSTGLYDRDRIIVYFIGHGIHDSGQFWLLTDGFEQSHSRVNVTQMQNYIATYGPNQISIFSDACAGGVNLNSGGTPLIPKANHPIISDPELNHFFASSPNLSTYSHGETGPYFSQLVKSAMLDQYVPEDAYDPLYLQNNKIAVTDRSLKVYINALFADKLSKKNKYVKAMMRPGFTEPDTYRIDGAPTRIVPFSTTENTISDMLSLEIGNDIKKIDRQKANAKKALKFKKIKKKVDLQDFMSAGGPSKIILRNKDPKIFSFTTYGIYSKKETSSMSKIEGVGPEINFGGEIVSSKHATMSLPNYSGQLAVLDSRKKVYDLTSVLDRNNSQSIGLSVLKTLEKEAIYPETLKDIIAKNPGFMFDDPLGILATASINYLYGTYSQKRDLRSTVCEEVTILTIDEALALELEIKYNKESQELSAIYFSNDVEKTIAIKPVIPNFRFSWARMDIDKLPKMFDELLGIADKLDSTMISRFSDQSARSTLENWLENYFPLNNLSKE